MKSLLVLALLAACEPPLRPGQTRCTTTKDMFGVDHTDCQSYVAQPPPPRKRDEVQETIDEPAEAHGFYCASGVDGASFCTRERGECLRIVNGSGRCVRTKEAWCFSPGGCGANVDACDALRHDGEGHSCRETR